ncbi:hypothetical protein [Aliarcobacter vitoriensis]|uniref:hypothetical protein n=1 Tax=Aliarcobacter vitoriensis TaxID=2011099 RepID=UPI001C9C5AA1|nr:hypothetical protein [Aliarcobacter vitoriensis]
MNEILKRDFEKGLKEILSKYDILKDTKITINYNEKQKTKKHKVKKYEAIFLV